MRVALVSQNVSPGLLIFRRDLIVYLVSKGHEVFGFASDFSPETKKELIALGAVPVDYSISRAGLSPAADIRTTVELYRIFKSISPDVVFSFFVKPSIYGMIAAGLSRVSHRVAMLEGLGYMYTPDESGFTLKKRLLQRIHGLLTSVAYIFAHKVLFLNPDDPIDLSSVAYISPRKIEVFGPIGLNLSEYTFKRVSEKKGVSFIFVARLLAEKGVHQYIEAAKLIRADYPDARFILLGGLDVENPSGLREFDLKQLVDEGVVEYPGFVSDVSKWIEESSVFVLPSYYREGVPRSTQEAMAIGRAIITTDVPGCRETVKNGQNGFLVPPFKVRELAEKMRYFIDNPSEISRMGAKSHDMAVEKFDVRKVNIRLAGLLNLD